MINFARPDLCDIHHMLAAKNALIVHFSGTPPGAGSNFDHRYPNDLAAVIAESCHGGLSCSTVMPLDEFADLNGANATGCVGVILGLQSGRSILDANRGDCGSRVENGRRLFPNARDLTIADLEATIAERADNSYNEWCIGDYMPVGIFAASPFRVWREVRMQYPSDFPNYLKDDTPILGATATTLAEIECTFPGQSVFSFVEGQLCQFAGGGWHPVKHEEVYHSVK